MTGAVPVPIVVFLIIKTAVTLTALVLFTVFILQSLIKGRIQSEIRKRDVTTSAKTFHSKGNVFKG